MAKLEALLEKMVGERADGLRLLASIVDQATEAILVTDARLESPGPAILLVNDAFTRMTGYEPEEVLGRTPRVLQGPGTDRRVLDRLRAALAAGEPFSGSTVNYRKDGSPYDLEWSVGPVRDDAGDVRFFVAVQRDVSDRNRIEAELRATRAFLENARSLARLGSWSVDLAADRCLLWSPEMLSIFGLDEASFDGCFETLEARIHPDDRARVRRALEEAVAERAPCEIEHRIVRPDGAIRHVLVRADVLLGADRRPSRLVGLTQDVTERRLDQQALGESQERFRAAAEGSLDALLFLRAVRSGRGEIVDFEIVDLNARAERMLSRPRAELLGHRIQSAGSFLASREVFEKYAHVTERREALEEEFSLPDEGGTAFFQHQVVPLADGVAVTARNVTERQAMLARMVEAQRIEAVGKLAGGVAHDFNNMLSAILGFGSLVFEELDQAHPLRDDVGEIVRAAERASSMTRQLLAFSRQQVLETRVLDLGTCVREMNMMLGRLIGEDIEIEYVLEPGLWPVEADPTQLEQVVLNLALNARDAMPRGGKLVFETKNLLLGDEEAERLGLPPGSYVALAVSDTGNGMPEAVKRRAFEPFFTTKPVGAGTGLGLATVFGIVKQSGGHVDVESEVDRGTVFRIFLPRTEADARAGISVERKRWHRSLSGSETILLVEDEELVRHFVWRTLKKHGYWVLEAKDGVEAVAVAERHRGSIDLVLTDVVMPRLGGPELAEKIRALRPGVRILYMSGYAESLVESRGGLEPGVDFVQKPIAPLTLLTRIRDMLDRPSPR